MRISTVTVDHAPYSSSARAHQDSDRGPRPLELRLPVRISTVTVAHAPKVAGFRAKQDLPSNTSQCVVYSYGAGVCSIRYELQGVLS